MVQVRRDVDAQLVAPNEQLRGQLKLIAFDCDFFVRRAAKTRTAIGMSASA
jgi:hypothetical protein